ncbi:MAG: GNAT family N-acetyltransferase [Alphaproteobacteria bacterium]|nr:GNAT family N-acetyltransferase [Alphaproteobacteria bacterium]
MSDEAVVICRAEAEYIDAIYSLIEKQIVHGSILPMSLEEIKYLLNRFLVVRINDRVVGIACLKDYGFCAELSKVCIDPEYRGRGIAPDLVSSLVKMAIDLGYKYVFALTVNDTMARIFESQSFVQIDRTLLCRQWSDRYDMSRPSKAFVRYF